MFSLKLSDISDKKDKIDDKHKPIAIVRQDDSKSNKIFNKNKLLYLVDGEKGQKKIDLKINEVFEPVPSTNPDKRDCYFIAGASGSGKSYITTKIVANYQKLYPQRNIFLVSALTADSTIDKIKNVIRLTEDDIIDFNVNDIKYTNSFIIFDDWENMELLPEVKKMIKDVLITGRKHTEGQGCISCCILSHTINIGRPLGTLILNECNYYIVYPSNTSHYSLNYILGRYVGITDKDIKALKKLKSRWVLIHKDYPQYFISCYQAGLFHQDD